MGYGPNGWQPGLSVEASYAIGTVDLMATLVCQVKSRLPIAVVALFGTLDNTSAARMMVALRDALAAAPAALVIDAEHMVVASSAVLVPIRTLATEAWTWPQARIGVCGMDRALGESFGADVDLYDTVDEAVEVGRAIPISPRRTLALTPDSHAPARARQFTLETCTEWGLGKYCNLAELLASELVTNAVVHARTPMDVTLRMMDASLSVAVRDGDPRPMYRPIADGTVTTEHGRGLLLLDAMADDWGCNPTVDGKVVWARIRLA
jgi:Histidine kinase-like ATPase domain